MGLTVLAAAACVAGAAQAGSGPGLADGTVLTRRADLLAAQPPAAFGTIYPPHHSQSVSPGGLAAPREHGTDPVSQPSGTN